MQEEVDIELTVESAARKWELQDPYVDAPEDRRELFTSKLKGSSTHWQDMGEWSDHPHRGEEPLMEEALGPGGGDFVKRSIEI